MHDFGNGVQDLFVASAAAGGAVGYFLNVLECLLYAGKIDVLVQRVFNIEKADFFAVADHVVFHNIPPPYKILSDIRHILYDYIYHDMQN